MGRLNDSAKTKSSGCSSDHCAKRSAALAADNPQTHSMTAAYRPKRRMLSIRTLGSDAAEVKFYRSLEPLKTPKAKRSRGSSFDQFARSTPALNPSVKRRHAQTKRLLTSSAFAALKRLRDFAGAGPFPRECFQGSHVCWRPRTPFLQCLLPSRRPKNNLISRT